MAPLSSKLEEDRKESLSARLDSDAQKPSINLRNNGQLDPKEFVIDGFLVSHVKSEIYNSTKILNQEHDGAEVCELHLKGQAPPPDLGWPLAGKKKNLFHEKLRRKNMRVQKMENEKEKEKQVSDMDLMKERFAKLLLGEDMSGGSKGVSSALALSNAITNLSASIFGEHWRLEPLPLERKARWRKEIDWFLSVTDYIVELIPTRQITTNGTQVEVMVAKQRLDLLMNIPALRKLDTMLMDVLEEFTDNEFWYEGRSTSDSTKDQRQEHKWWLPTPRVPETGLSEDTRRFLQNQRDAVKQILKAVMAINAQVLSEMEIPDVYMESLPKNGKSSLGDVIYRHITAENFSPEALLSSLDLSTEHNILDVKNRIEASISVWKRKIIKDGKSTSLSSWGSSNNHEKRELFGDRAETILLLLKQRYPGLPQSVLDINKIQYNKDVGQSILESYSRVLESRAFNIMSRIDDVLYADSLTRLPPPPSTFERSSSYGSTRTNNSISDDQTSFWTQSPTPCVRETPYSSPNNFEPIASENNPTVSPQSMTLSDYIGWSSKDNDNMDNLCFKETVPALQDPHKASKKHGAMSTNKGRQSYVEKLESLGIMHSPAARD